MRRPHNENDAPRVMPPETADRIGKLILMLGSNHEGEALNAVRLIEATLKGVGLDLHALASVVTMRTDRNGYFVPQGPRPSDAACWNYANHFRQGRDVDAASLHPDSLTFEFGLPLYSPDIIESWREVARHCLKLNREIPKAAGGKFLRPFEVEVLTRLADGQWPRNAQVDWIKTVVARCHQARDKAREAKP